MVHISHMAAVRTVFFMIYLFFKDMIFMLSVFAFLIQSL